MGYKYSFIDNETYGADDINAAISCLTTAGVSVCPTNLSTIKAMNAVTAAAASSGVEFNQNSCVVQNGSTGYIKIKEGTAFFDNGIIISIDSDGITLPKRGNNYVYLYYNPDTDSCYAEQATTMPTGHYVLLAFVDSSGFIQDRRQYATSKLAPGAPHGVYECYRDISYYGYNDYTTTPLFTLDVGHPNATGVAFDNPQWYAMGYGLFDEEGYTPYISVSSHLMALIRFKKVGNKIEVYLDRRREEEFLSNVRITVF